MKIQIVKNGNSKVKVMNTCPWIIDVPAPTKK